MVGGFYTNKAIKQKQMSNRTYEIDSLERLCNVANVENVKTLSLDFANTLIHYVCLIQEIRERHPEETKGKLNCEIAEFGMTWIDDGKVKIKDVVLISKETGEVLSKNKKRTK